MRTLLLCAVLVGLAGGALAAQQPARPISPSGAPGAVAKGTVTVRLEILPATGLTYSWVDKPNAAGARVADGRIAIQGGQPGDLTIEIWKASDRPSPVAERRELVVAAPVRLQRDTTGRPRGTVPARIIAALDTVKQQSGVYTVAVAY